MAHAHGNHHNNRLIHDFRDHCHRQSVRLLSLLLFVVIHRTPSITITEIRYLETVRLLEPKTKTKSLTGRINMDFLPQTGPFIKPRFRFTKGLRL